MSNYQQKCYSKGCFSHVSFYSADFIATSCYFCGKNFHFLLSANLIIFVISPYAILLEQRQTAIFVFIVSIAKHSKVIITDGDRNICSCDHPPYNWLLFPLVGKI